MEAKRSAFCGKFTVENEQTGIVVIPN